MSARELFLLSPYRLPTHHTLHLSDDDTAAFLNAAAALWRPAALLGAAGPPRVASPYDHEQPAAGRLYATPEHPPLLLPDDWDRRLKDAGAAAFKATPDRAATLANLKSALRALPAEFAPPAELIDLDDARAAPFLGVGFGHAFLDALFEAMSHENVLDAAEFWKDVQAAAAALAAAGDDTARVRLKAAAERLANARDVVYPSSLFVIDLGLLDDARPDSPWPGALEKGLPVNLVACSALLERIGREQPDRLAALRERVAAGLAEVCGGVYAENADALLPLESQLWNLLKGRETYKALLGQDVRVFGRRRFGFHPHTPLLLQSVGIPKALLLVYDESVLPGHRTAVVNWPSPDGKQVQSFTRTPLPAGSPQTFFHLAHHLHRTVMQDHVATLALLHRDQPAGPWYDDWVELTRLAPVLGRWATLPKYLDEVLAGDYTSPAAADEFHGDYLVERANPPAGREPGPERREPVSGFARRLRARRRLDTAWALAALNRGLGGEEVESAMRTAGRLRGLEDRLETSRTATAELVKDLSAAQDEAAAALARRLTARGQANNPGYLLLNPCSFNRRVALELGESSGPVPVGGPVKASQLDGNVARVVAEVPALGFAWVPLGKAAAAPAGRMRLADDRCVRNEYFEAEIDPATGGLRAIRDPRTRTNRLGQQMVYNPGGAVAGQSVKTTSTGPALGEIVAEGVIWDGKDEVLAWFRQRFRAWLGRPLLEIRIDIQPARPPQGYPWHAYYGARFAWRDENAALRRGVLGVAYPTSHTRPETPDYLELRADERNTVIFPGGLPFHQRHGGRMLDVVLVVEGEETQSFDLAIGLDREHPAQTALGLATPAPVVAASQGPRHVGAVGWLFHLDAPDLLLSGLRPAADGADAVVARLLDCGGHGGHAVLRCARNPVKARLEDARGEALLDAPVQEDVVHLDVQRNDLVQVRVDFS
jgi:hypothetical protein